jgi:hypothetical protein
MSTCTIRVQQMAYFKSQRMFSKPEETLVLRSGGTGVVAPPRLHDIRCVVV